MDKRNTRLLQVFVSLLLSINIFLVVTQINWSDWDSKVDLDYSKDIANEIVMSMQRLASDLGVSEKTNVKQSLAKLHYDVYLAASRKDLAGIIQHTASDTRKLIVSEYVNASAEQVLKILNGVQEVKTVVVKTAINLEPLPDGGYQVLEPHRLSAETLAELAELPTLFDIDIFRTNFESYRNLASLHIEIENGIAYLAIPSNDRDTIKHWEREIQNIRTDYSKIAKLAGFAETSGPGISIDLHDKYFPLQAGDLRRIVSELFSAGASAISINGHRLATSSYIIDEISGISVDGFLIETNPVKIQVLGDPATLLTGIDLLFSVVFKDMYYISTKSYEHLVLPGKIIQ